MWIVIGIEFLVIILIYTYGWELIIGLLAMWCELLDRWKLRYVRFGSLLGGTVQFLYTFSLISKEYDLVVSSIRRFFSEKTSETPKPFTLPYV